MSLKKINSIYFHQRNQVVKSMCQNHIVKQQKKAEQDQNPSHLKNLNIDCLKVTANYLPYLDQINLVSTCEELRGKPPVLQPDFNIDTIKNAFENEVNQFVNLFKDDNGNFKHRNNIANEINNGTIMLHQDLLVLKEGFKAIFSKMSDDYDIKLLLLRIKDNISPNKLEELASVAIEKMTGDFSWEGYCPIKDLLVEIKGNISPNKLEELASIVIKKISFDFYFKYIVITDLLVNIKDKISQKELAELASIAIEKMSNDAYIGYLLVAIKDNISQDKLAELASIAIKKMSDNGAIRDLLVNIKDNISQEKLEDLASISIEKMSDDDGISYLVVEIKDKISKEHLAELNTQRKLKNRSFCTIM